jgi:hypothetical protein
MIKTKGKRLGNKIYAFQLFQGSSFYTVLQVAIKCKNDFRSSITTQKNLKELSTNSYMDSTIYFVFFALAREYYKSQPFLNHSMGKKKQQKYHYPYG